MSAALDVLPHPLPGGVAAIEHALDGMPVGGWDGLEPQLVRELATRMMRAEARLKAHQLAAARRLEASGITKQSGATSAGAMLAGSFGGDQRAAESACIAAGPWPGHPLPKTLWPQERSVTPRRASSPTPSTTSPMTPPTSRSSRARRA